ncbi:hypothetical protein CBR_g39623 [Chara braunii]|uniref:Uncharacterized protein n=1 Tax=Chara braunii TaxID=69332 RepID=A0A388K1C1_CHABU|nr:hypothetical protein CBR_g39623 [Chara braunii]|eukprot:GBG63838.1 hypothetical protein CBR_g39623 [Chara braunii]
MDAYPFLRRSGKTLGDVDVLLPPLPLNVPHLADFIDGKLDGIAGRTESKWSERRNWEDGSQSLERRRELFVIPLLSERDKYKATPSRPIADGTGTADEEAAASPKLSGSQIAAVAPSLVMLGTAGTSVDAPAGKPQDRDGQEEGRTWKTAAPIDEVGEGEDDKEAAANHVIFHKADSGLSVPFATCVNTEFGHFQPAALIRVIKQSRPRLLARVHINRHSEIAEAVDCLSRQGVKVLLRGTEELATFQANLVP